MPRWIGASTAAQTYDLTYDQVVQAVMMGIVRGSETGNGMLVNPVDVEANLDRIRSLPPRFWAYKSHAAKEFGLTRNQIDTAIALGIVRFKKVKNPNYSSGPEATLVAIPDLEANLDRIRSFSQYSRKELAARHRHNVRRRLRERLAFRCPRCGEKIYPHPYVFEDILMGDVDYGRAREDLVIQHYYQVHTDYEKDHQDVDKWLRPEEVYEATKGKFQSFKSLVEWYEGRRGEMGRSERKAWGRIVDGMRYLAAERAEHHYVKVAARLAIADGLIEPIRVGTEEGGTSRSTDVQS
ncbi:hypothetical protein [Conexivisphaera calida]|uniref:Uncharacterized protein n=1 Tax=Conexivisphaera calida TaxID=1874277 RepID=A0A4P2VGT7_9ARCH|nr:hypothetical protein [Conexivisphaera calida]BBE42653.1 hypothetical protein NAS2_1264 [Conexivisphaera calida]